MCSFTMLSYLQECTNYKNCAKLHQSNFFNHFQRLFINKPGSGWGVLKMQIAEIFVPTQSRHFQEIQLIFEVAYILETLNFRSQNR